MGRRRSACSRQPAAGARKTSGRARTVCGSTRPSSACPSPRPRRASSLRPRRRRKSSRNSRDSGDLHGLERGIIQACCDPASSCNGTALGAAPGSTTCGCTTSTAPSPAARWCSARASRPSSECPATSGHTSGDTTAISLATWCFGAAVGVAADIVGETLTVGTCGPACRPPDPGRNAPAPGAAKKSEKGSPRSLARTSRCASMVRSCHLCRLGEGQPVSGRFPIKDFGTVSGDSITIDTARIMLVQSRVQSTLRGLPTRPLQNEESLRPHGARVFCYIAEIIDVFAANRPLKRGPENPAVITPEASEI